MRSGDWKYIRYFDQKPVVEQLFDLKKDSGETIDLSSKPDFSAKLQEMRDRTDRCRASLQSGHGEKVTSKNQ
jgi:arylsulfatase A-like enzyme